MGASAAAYPRIALSPVAAAAHQLPLQRDTRARQRASEGESVGGIGKSEGRETGGRKGARQGARKGARKGDKFRSSYNTAAFKLLSSNFGTSRIVPGR